ncbi:uncharacterized protein LOC128860120 [Anastrepha ludens]|uniref:uncharacterized protein LOC128860120 n=1 Tax=Anastrepha ludens TaxID=28586 RepID=UPI0023B1128B|nr:uncharacterized protein LOC128860120 [Anastrepha ludens]
MPPAKSDLDLTDKVWVDSYVKKCDFLMKEFTSYVYALQNHCAKERSRCEQLDKDCKRLQKELKNKSKEKNEPQEICDTGKESIRDSELKTSTESEADRTCFSDCSPAFLNMAMDSEQLQMDATCVLSPAQHRQELVSATEQLSSPSRLSLADNIFQHNTSPTCKQKARNENISALGFLKARGRIGKVLDSHKLRERNCAAGEEDHESGMRKNRGKLHARSSDWLGKYTKNEDRGAALKRATTGIDDIQRKRCLLTLNKGNERKLKQARLTQIVDMKSKKVQNVESLSTTPEYTVDAQMLPLSPTTPVVLNVKKKLDFPSFTSDTGDIFHFSSDDDDEPCSKSVNANTVVKQSERKCVDGKFLQPLRAVTESSASVLAITPTPPPIICLYESDDNAQGSENNTRNLTTNNVKRANIKVKQEKSTSEKLPTALAAAMLAEWTEELEDNERDVKLEAASMKKARKTLTSGLKPRRAQLPVEKISIKECFNIDCDECQKYIDFMGSNMSLAEIESHLRRCTRHRTSNDCIPVTPPDYWNPLMPSFSENDPRNKTLLVDPCLQQKRSVNNKL